MSEKGKWSYRSEKANKGIRKIVCEDWTGYTQFIENVLINYANYIFRGQSNSKWSLQPSLNRALLKTHSGASRESVAGKHLDKFKYATRGRRGLASKDPANENEWWALGQHHGLFTPLLDWSESPYVAAYFALTKEKPDTEYASVYALGRSACERENDRIKLATKSEIAPILEFVRPMTDDNPRLISQRGLFTRAPNFVSIEEWVETYFEKVTRGVLLQIDIPHSARSRALVSLNKMNINHLSLFPDLYGAGKHCNLALNIDKYH
ncbi:FRG domain-containing protein [Ectopseudomonas oleovorans]|uniref:FRG domain-containing protein n=1 Tax=Ectopseudomonas oleovorans TaxID=301 RepID=A0A3D9EV40_ECTOL|nr:FRG domain-containing protein [Pseudomonas oleovorans]RED07009.1 FRG domain-containing protein [Pseudomonas oleovorans]